jgi:hypothetical protein
MSPGRVLLWFYCFCLRGVRSEVGKIQSGLILLLLFEVGPDLGRMFMTAYLIFDLLT